jgi:hypothetical protein
MIHSMDVCFMPSVPSLASGYFNTMTDMKTKSDMVPPQPTDHSDSRMHLTLDDLRQLTQSDPKVVHPLQYANPSKTKQ